MVVVCTGPESTGKSTLAKQISTHFNWCLVPEMSREILEKSNGYYTFETIDDISKCQWREQIETTQQCENVCCDTDLLTNIVWGEVKFKRFETWWWNTWINSQVDLFLLCAPDLEWEFDPLRENPHDRDMLFEQYRKHLDLHSSEYKVIEGNGKERTSQAISIIEKMLDSSQ